MPIKIIARTNKKKMTPKNADILDYRRATGLEALFGYLHLGGKSERLAELMELAFNNANNEITE